MQYEGRKETENTRIQKDEETLEEIEMLYTFEVVLFEHVLLETDEKTISICYFAPDEIYDIVIEDKKKHKLIKYETTPNLREPLDKYYQLNKDEKIVIDNTEVRCTSHSIEYTL